MLGGTLESIAWHKAGIMQPGTLAVTVPQHPAVMRILHTEAEQVGARLMTDPQALPLALFTGKTAAPDSRDATVTFYNALLPPPGGMAGCGLGSALPGRGERVHIGGRDVLIDGGHTPGAARWLRGLIELLAGSDTPVRLVAAMLLDKNAAGYLSAFDQPRFSIMLTQTSSHRAADPEALRAAADFQHAAVEVQPDTVAALRAALAGPEALVVVGGSLRLAAAAREALGLLTPELAAEARATRALFEGPGYLGRMV
jgi:folylpolyglutamate synthase/dihydropteroate synthase